MSDSRARLGAQDPDRLTLNPQIQLRWRQMGDEWLVFEVLSGQTHQIDSATAAMLMVFEAGEPLSFTELLARLRVDFDLAADDIGARANVERALRQFQTLGLVLPVRLSEKLHATV